MTAIKMKQVFLILSLFILNFLCSCTNCQQNYSGNSILNCKNNDEKGPSPAFLYTCNGLQKSCQAFQIFPSQPPYNSVSTISNLMSSNPEELARINNVTINTVFTKNKEVIIPVNCSCVAKDYYQANTTYMVKKQDTYLHIANNTYQGLSTCDSLLRANSYGESELKPGFELNVPLRCACPTVNQTLNGASYLLTYPIYGNDDIPKLGRRFNIGENTMLEANGFSAPNPVLFPFTTIVIPLFAEPLSSQTIIRAYEPSISPPPTSNTKKNSKRKLHVWVAVFVSCFVLVLPCILAAVFLYKRGSLGLLKRSRKGKGISALTEDICVEIATIEHDCKVFNFEEIQRATENLGSERYLEGSVYGGKFGKEILAVQKVNKDASGEVNLLRKINHFNIIRLEGYCQNMGSFYLVLEYMKNGSLREWLSRGSSNDEHKNWTRRIQIALDVANGLHYLHNFTAPCYVHKNLNTGNILLNSNLRAKIANLSLARATETETNSVYPTANIVGTRGYMAPEYMEAGQVTAKIDVYAFGVVLLELITGKDAIFMQDGKHVLLSATIKSVMERENGEAELTFLIDHDLKGKNGEESALHLFKLSLACLIQEPERRPNIADVVSGLMKIKPCMEKQNKSPIKN